MSLYQLSKEAVLETFTDGGVVLVLPERRLVELNPSAVEIIKLLDGHHTPEQVAVDIAKIHEFSPDYPVTRMIQDVLELCRELYQTGVLEPNSNLQERVNMKPTDATRFLRNPDVVLREEDPDEGALLFNPDTNQVKVINTTSLFIWQQFDVARTIDEIVVEVQKGFDEVPSEQVALDVREFVDSLLASGFIGTVEK